MYITYDEVDISVPEDTINSNFYTSRLGDSVLRLELASEFRVRVCRSGVW